MSRNPTLIVFCREPIPGRTKTRLIPRLGGKSAAALADAFIADTLAKCATLGPARLVIAASAAADTRRSPYFRHLAHRCGAEVIDQGGGNLGTRMARALTPYCRDGAVLLGTDTPTLPSRLLARSVALLRRAPVVLAPSLDGGYYLVGARGALPDIFHGIRWGGRRVLAQTVARMRRRHVRYALGPGWYDVDRWSDVLLLAAHLELLHARGDRATPCPATAGVLRRLGLLADGR
jgi:rSAM/selenodomain-associated transferase 1